MFSECSIGIYSSVLSFLDDVFLTFSHYTVVSHMFSSQQIIHQGCCKDGITAATSGFVSQNPESI